VFEDNLKLISPTILASISEFSQVLKNSGYRCYLVGGSCRDLLLGVVPHDFDFATDCPLPETRQLFKKVVETGSSYGTLTIFYQGLSFEITRFRKDLKTDGRKAVVGFSDSIVDDQKRRDLKINAIAYDVVSGELIDSQNGLGDIRERRISFVGSAAERIREDHLRALRYLRMIATLKKLGFQYDPLEMKQVKTVFNPSVLSLERIYEEFSKLFQIKGSDLSFLAKSLTEFNLFDSYLPDSVRNYPFFRKILDSRSLLPFFLEYQKLHGNRKTAIDLKLNRQQRKLIALLAKYHSIQITDKVRIKMLMAEVEQQELETVGGAFLGQLGVDIIEPVKIILKEKMPYKISHLQLNGNDLLQFGIQGRQIGKLQRYLLSEVLKSPACNSKAQLRNLAEAHLARTKKI
jgi:tRNA nucleotidyltransferase/poly(A) polymerase